MPFRTRTTAVALLLGLLVSAAVSTPGQEADAARGIDRIGHLIVIYQENWSFDSLFGTFPRADGIANAGDTVKQVKKDGTPYATLPQTDPRIPGGLPVGPFDLAPYIPPTAMTVSPEDGFYEAQYQINGGLMNKYVAWSAAAGLSMSYYDATDMPLGELAKEYTLCDRFFASAFGQSFLNHIWLIAARSPEFPGAPDKMIAKFDAHGDLLNPKGYKVTPDMFAVGDLEPIHPPTNPNKPPDERVPAQTFPTIGDRLNERGIPWAWYAEGWDAGQTGDLTVLVPHHQPFNYFANYAAGTPGREHLQDVDDFLQDVADGSLPPVAFVKPGKPHDMHPGRSLTNGQSYVASLVRAVRYSRIWRDCAIIITFDENGGRWDHAAPPAVDRWGPGCRVPTIIVSPFARRRFIDHTAYETTSILKLIERRWGLAPLTLRDANAPNILRPFGLDPDPRPGRWPPVNRPGRT